MKSKDVQSKYKNGYKFELRLGDSSKEIMYKYWGPDDEEKVNSVYDSIKSDDVVHIQGRINEWNNNFEISANKAAKDIQCNYRKVSNKYKQYREKIIEFLNKKY